MLLLIRDTNYKLDFVLEYTVCKECAVIMKRIYLLDLNYTLVANQKETRELRPFIARLAKEEYRKDLVESIKDDYVIIITARPDYQGQASLKNVKTKTGWQPQEAYFNDINAEPPVFKESALLRFVFPMHGTSSEQYIAIESNPKTRAMYKKYGIEAMPYEEFINIKVGGSNVR